MDPTPMFIAALTPLPAVGLVVWARFSLDQINVEQRPFIEREDTPFDIGPQTGADTRGAIWRFSG